MCVFDRRDFQAGDSPGRGLPWAPDRFAVASMTGTVFGGIECALDALGRVLAMLAERDQIVEEGAVVDILLAMHSIEEAQVRGGPIVANRNALRKVAESLTELADQFRAGHLEVSGFDLSPAEILDVIESLNGASTAIRRA